MALNAEARRETLVLPGCLAPQGPERGSGEASYSLGELGPGQDLNQDPKDPAVQARMPVTQLTGRQPRVPVPMPLAFAGTRRAQRLSGL